MCAQRRSAKDKTPCRARGFRKRPTEKSMSGIDEDQLIERVIVARAELGVSTNAELLTLLESDFKGLTMSEVKKAASKATKRTGGAGVPSATAPSPAPSPAPRAEKAPSKRQEKAQEKAKVTALAELKSAEATMMEAQRRLRAAREGKIGSLNAVAPVNIEGTAEQFIQRITQAAIAGIIDADDEPFIKLRIEADIAALEWVKMAQENGAISLKENVIALGMEVQLARLIKARDTKDTVAGRECYKLVEKPLRARDVSIPVDANVELDARVKAHSATATQQTGSGEMEQMD